MNDRPVINVGDRIRFRCATVWGDREVVRVVNGFVLGNCDRPTVRYGGWPTFIVREYEILEVIPQGGAS